MADTDASKHERIARRALVDAALRDQDWPKIHKQLVLLAFARCKSPALAKDLAQDAIRRAFDPAYCAWDPEKEPKLVRYLGSIVNGLLRNERVSARARSNVVLDDDATADLRDMRALSEDSATERDLSARRVAMLRTRLETKGDALALSILALTIDGVETPAALATELGRPVDDIVFARRRMHRAAAEVARALHGMHATIEETS